MSTDNRREIAAEFLGGVQRVFARAADRFTLETPFSAHRMLLTAVLSAVAAQCEKRRDELAAEFRDDPTTLN